MQSRRFSLIESITNILVGYLVAVGSQIVIFPMFGYAIKLEDNFLIGLWFAMISVVRSYFLRRCFNAIKK